MKSTLRYSLSIALLTVGALVLACNKQTASTPTTPPPAPADAPFKTAEPDKYQTEIWQTRGGSVEKYFIARDGDKWRVDSAYGDPKQVTTLHTDKDYILAMSDKVYAEIPPQPHGYEDQRPQMVREISMGLLNLDHQISVQKQNSDGSQTTYKIFGDPKEGSESIVTVDDKLGLPVKKEVFSGTAGAGQPTVTVALNNFSTNVAPNSFEIPKDFKKVPIEDMKPILTRQ